MKCSMKCTNFPNRILVPGTAVQWVATSLHPTEQALPLPRHLPAWWSPSRRARIASTACSLTKSTTGTEGPWPTNLALRTGPIRYLVETNEESSIDTRKGARDGSTPRR
jgi:hypothetical protein